MGVAYAGVPNQTLGWKIHLDKNEMKNSTHHLAMMKKHKDLTFKGQIDNLLNAQLWGNLDFKNGINLQGSIAGNLSDHTN